MKKLITIVSLICFIIVLTTGCGKKTEKASSINTDKLESVSVGSEKISLKYKFEKGEKFTYKLTTIMSNDETVLADSTVKSKANQTLSYIFDCEVIDVDEEKTAEMNIKVTSIKFDATINGQKLTYNTDQKISDQDKLKFMEYETLYNSPFRARITSRGEVIEVSRVEKMVDKMNNMSPQKQNLTAEQRAEYARQLGERAIKPIAQMIFREQPGHTVVKDSIWEKRVPQQLGTLTMENIARFKVLDFVKIGDERAAKISAALSATFSGKKEGTENGITYNFGDPKISGEGIILFNFDAGKLVKADTGTKSEITVTMEGKNSLQKVKKTKRITNSTNRTIVELL